MTMHTTISSSACSIMTKHPRQDFRAKRNDSKLTNLHKKCINDIRNTNSNNLVFAHQITNGVMVSILETLQILARAFQRTKATNRNAKTKRNYHHRQYSSISHKS